MSDHDEAHCHRCNPPTTPCGDPTCGPCYEHEHGHAVTIPRLDAIENRVEDMGKREDRQATWIGKVEDRVVGLERAIVRIEQSMGPGSMPKSEAGGNMSTYDPTPKFGGALPVDQASPTVRLVAERDEARVKLKDAEATISRFANERDDAIAKQKADAEGYAIAIKRVTDERDVARIEAHTMRCSMSMHHRVFPWESK